MIKNLIIVFLLLVCSILMYKLANYECESKLIYLKSVAELLNK